MSRRTTIEGLSVRGIEVLRDGRPVGQLRRSGARRGGAVLWHTTAGEWAGAQRTSRVDALLDLARQLRASPQPSVVPELRIEERTIEGLGRCLDLVVAELGTLAFAVQRDGTWLLGPHRALAFEFAERKLRGENEARHALIAHAGELQALRRRDLRIAPILGRHVPGRSGRALRAEAECTLSAGALLDLLLAARRRDPQLEAALTEFVVAAKEEP